jgi:hypothetical protein
MKNHKAKKDKYEELAGDFKNEAELEEELEEEGTELKEVENKHFEEDDNEEKGI